jgi:very-short-patch-repair endonuclease
MATRRKTAGKRSKGPSDLEVLFANLWAIAGDRTRRPVREYRFAENRGWRFDFAWPDSGVKVAVELEGGVWTGGRHTRGAGFIADCEKYNFASEIGWVVLRYTRDDLEKRSVQTIQQIRRVIERRATE